MATPDPLWEEDRKKVQKYQDDGLDNLVKKLFPSARAEEILKLPREEKINKVTDERMRLAQTPAPSQQTVPSVTPDVLQTMLEMMRLQQEESRRQQEESSRQLQETIDLMRRQQDLATQKEETLKEENLAERQLREEEAVRRREAEAAARVRREELDAERRHQVEEKENRIESRVKRANEIIKNMGTLPHEPLKLISFSQN